MFIIIEWEDFLGAYDNEIKNIFGAFDTKHEADVYREEKINTTKKVQFVHNKDRFEVVSISK